MAEEINENYSPDSVDPSGFRRFLFWLSYVLGTLVLLFAWLLSMVPGRPDFTGDFVIRTTASSLVLISILLARWVWRIYNPFSESNGSISMRVILGIAWTEFGIGLCGVLGTVAYKLFRH